MAKNGDKFLAMLSQPLLELLLDSCVTKSVWEVFKMEQIIVNMTLVIGIVGVLAFAVSVITQVFKGVSGLKKIPTDILVFVLSIGLTVTAFVAYMDYIHQTIIWYMILAAILAGLLVAFVAMYGWEKVAELWKRFYVVNKDENSEGE